MARSQIQNKSKRRLENLRSINGLLDEKLSAKTHDPLAQFPELDKWDVYLVDGHYQKAASFDPKYLSSEDKMKTMTTGHFFFRLNVRTQHLSCLDFVKPEDGKKKAHDVTVIRRSDPENEGVISSHLVGTSNQIQLRRIVYKNPKDAKIYTYLTNDVTLPPWLVVLIYKQRWDIEKVFYELKSKMKEIWCIPLSKGLHTGHNDLFAGFRNRIYLTRSWKTSIASPSLTC